MNNYLDITIFGISFHVTVSTKVAFIAYWKNWWKEIKTFSEDEDKKDNSNVSKTEQK